MKTNKPEKIYLVVSHDSLLEDTFVYPIAYRNKGAAETRKRRYENNSSYPDEERIEVRPIKLVGLKEDVVCETDPVVSAEEMG
jgi:hypothetical protein